MKGELDLPGSDNKELVRLELIVEKSRNENGELVDLNLAGALSRHTLTDQEISMIAGIINLHRFSLRRVNLSKNNLSNQQISYFLGELKLNDSVLNSLVLSEQNNSAEQFDSKKLGIFLEKVKQNRSLSHLKLEQCNQNSTEQFGLINAIQAEVDYNSQAVFAKARCSILLGFLPRQILETLIISFLIGVHQIKKPVIVENKDKTKQADRMVSLEIKAEASEDQIDDINLNAQFLKTIFLRDCTYFGPTRLLRQIYLLPTAVLESIIIFDQQTDIGANILWGFLKKLEKNPNFTQLVINPDLENEFAKPALAAIELELAYNHERRVAEQACVALQDLIEGLLNFNKLEILPLIVDYLLGTADSSQRQAKPLRFILSEKAGITFWRPCSVALDPGLSSVKSLSL